MLKTKILLTKSQSILEYLIILGAIILAIVANTVGLQRSLQKNLDTNQKVLEAEAKGSEAPANVKNEEYYASASQQSNSEWNNTDTYAGTAYKNQYYFHEGNSDMSYVPKEGTVLDKDETYVAVPYGSKQ